MEQYHINWLTKHPHRTKEWLMLKLADGFDIHHIDGNHDNNDPDNLVLIESDDHMRLHDFPFSRISGSEIKKRKRLEREKIQDEEDFRTGRFITKTIKGNIYWYFQDNRTRHQRYIGRSNTFLERLFRTYNEEYKLQPKESWEKVKNQVLGYT